MAPISSGESTTTIFRSSTDRTIRADAARADDHARRGILAATDRAAPDWRGDRAGWGQTLNRTFIGENGPDRCFKQPFVRPIVKITEKSQYLRGCVGTT
jgi:hypothetical protein